MEDIIGIEFIWIDYFCWIIYESSDYLGGAAIMILRPESSSELSEEESSSSEES